MKREPVVGSVTISEVSELLGIPVPTIRSWERRYGFPAPSRTLGSHRRYDATVVEELRAVRDEIAAGVTAEEAVRYVRRSSVEGSRGSGFVKGILEAGRAFDANAIRDRLEAAASELGIDDAIQWVVLPALREIGSLWEAGRCDISQEHLASQEVRSWLANRIPARPERASSLVLLACGPKDLHTIGLEAFYVMLARRGLHARMLGASTPGESLVVAARPLEADAVVLTSHLNVNRRSAVEALVLVAKLDVKVFYAGNAFGAARSRRGVPGTYLGRDLTAAAALVEANLR
jgi:DNA-binding transcriptional MerR regulator